MAMNLETICTSIVKKKAFLMAKPRKRKNDASIWQLSTSVPIVMMKNIILKRNPLIGKIDLIISSIILLQKPKNYSQEIEK
jgi:hypothetical protein